MCIHCPSGGARVCEFGLGENLEIERVVGQRKWRGRWLGRRSCWWQNFNPTMDELGDLSSYTAHMESKGAHQADIAKIVLPKRVGGSKKRI